MVKSWAPSFENYRFNEVNGKTKVEVEMQTPSAYKDMFSEMWPKALEILKTISEK
jgi:hypothetical protein